MLEEHFKPFPEGSPLVRVAAVDCSRSPRLRGLAFGMGSLLRGSRTLGEVRGRKLLVRRCLSGGRPCHPIKAGYSSTC
jgi:hypothetical protein